MRRAAAFAAIALAVVMVLAATPAGSAERKPREAMFVGIDTSGSFRYGGYDDALSFVAHYIYGHLHELGGLKGIRELFVAAIGGREGNEPKAFRPIHDFAGKSVERIEADLKNWFPATDTLTDFNSFFRQIARISKERNLVLAPITIMLVSDGVPDVPGIKVGAPQSYQAIDVSGLEYLSKNVTIRLAYASPKVGEQWRQLVPRTRVRLWAVEAEVMRGWRAQIRPDAGPAGQDRLWKWVKDNVDYRVRTRGI
jgi:hypothetical protein